MKQTENTKYFVYEVDSMITPKGDSLLAELNDMEEVWEFIREDIIHRKNFIAHYYRTREYEGSLIIDYGSHHSFYKVTGERKRPPIK